MMVGVEVSVAVAVSVGMADAVADGEIVAVGTMVLMAEGVNVPSEGINSGCVGATGLASGFCAHPNRSARKNNQRAIEFFCMRQKYITLSNPVQSNFHEENHKKVRNTLDK